MSFDHYSLLNELPTGSGSQSLTPSLFSDADTFFAPTVSPGAVTLAPSLFSDADTFFSPIVTGTSDQTLTPSLYINENTFFSATVSGGAVTQGAGIPWREHRHKIGSEAKKKKRKAIERAEEVIAAIDHGLVEEINRLDDKIAALQAAESQAEIVAKAKMVEEFTAILKRMAEEDEDEDEALALILS